MEEDYDFKKLDQLFQVVSSVKTNCGLLSVRNFTLNLLLGVIGTFCG